MSATQQRPSDLVITVAGKGRRAPRIDGESWHFSDEIRGTLLLFGFKPSSQFVAARLKCMCEEDAPRFERRDSPWGDKQYRVTQWGRNEIGNKLPGLDR